MCTLTSKTVGHTIEFTEIPCNHNNDTDVILVRYGANDYALTSACPSRSTMIYNLGVSSKASCLKIVQRQGLRIVGESDRR